MHTEPEEWDFLCIDFNKNQKTYRALFLTETLVRNEEYHERCQSLVCMDGCERDGLTL